MKSTGVIRKVDDLGRITLLMEYRRALGIKEHDKLEMLQKGDEIILKKWKEKCIICGKEISKDNKIEVEDKFICNSCMIKLQKA